MRLRAPDPGWALPVGLVHLLSQRHAHISPRGSPRQVVFGRKPIGHVTCTSPKYLLRAHIVPGTVLGTEAAAENRQRQILSLRSMPEMVQDAKGSCLTPRVNLVTRLLLGQRDSVDQELLESGGPFSLVYL